MSDQLEAQGLLAAQVAGLRAHGMTTPAALRVVLPGLGGELAREVVALADALEQGSRVPASASVLLRALAKDETATPAVLWNVARGLAVESEAARAWRQVSRPWILGGAGVLLLLCGTGWVFAPLNEQLAVSGSATGWLILRVMRWADVPMALLWIALTRAAWLPFRASITRPFQLAASLHTRVAGPVPSDVPTTPEVDALWRPAERQVFEQLRARHGEDVAARELALEFERAGRASANVAAALSSLLCLVAFLTLIGLLLPILFLPIFSLAQASP